MPNEILILCLWRRGIVNKILDTRMMKFVKQYSDKTIKQKYLFWSIIVFLISLFAFFPSLNCFPSPPLFEVFIVNLASHLFAFYIYFWSGQLAFKIKNDWSSTTRRKIAIGFQYPFILFGILLILISIFGSLKIGNYHSIKDIVIGIALIISSLEKIKKLNRAKF